MLDSFAKVLYMLDSIGMGEQLSEQFGGEAQRQQIMAIMELLRGRRGKQRNPYVRES